MGIAGDTLSQADPAWVARVGGVCGVAKSRHCDVDWLISLYIAAFQRFGGDDWQRGLGMVLRWLGNNNPNKVQI